MRTKEIIKKQFIGLFNKGTNVYPKFRITYFYEAIDSTKHLYVDEYFVNSYGQKVGLHTTKLSLRR